MGIAITRREAGVDLGGDFPVLVPPFMEEIVEEISRVARGSRFVDHASGVSARLSIANYRTMVANARRRGIALGERPAVPRISDLAHITSSALGKLELDLMGSHQMGEAQAIEAIVAEAIGNVFGEYVDAHGLGEIAEVFAKGTRVEVGDMLPSAHYERATAGVPAAWSKAFEVNASENAAVRASCVEFVLAGLWATERISRSEKHGRVSFEVK
jgi:magnesium chelatase subunit I